jgi:hypothetical protein
MTNVNGSNKVCHNNKNCNVKVRYYLSWKIRKVLQHKTRLRSQILESEILVLCESVLQELSTNVFDIIIL